MEDFVIDARRRYVRAAPLVIAVLAVLTVVSTAFDFPGNGLVERLSGLDTENSVGTWLSSVNLLYAAAVAWLVSRSSDGFGRHWRLLAGVLLAFSVEEITGLHESTGYFLRESFGFDGVLHYAWIIPAVAATIVGGVLFVPFLLRLPAGTAWRLTLSGAAFSLGVIGFNAVGGALASAGVEQTFGVVLLATLEEVVELGSIAVLVVAMSAYLESRIRSEVGSDTGTEPVPPSGVDRVPLAVRKTA